MEDVVSSSKKSKNWYCLIEIEKCPTGSDNPINVFGEAFLQVDDSVLAQATTVLSRSFEISRSVSGL